MNARPVVMLQRVHGSPDGIHDYWYMQGREYPTADVPLSEELRETMLREGWAVDADEFGGPMPEAAVETQMEAATDTTATCGVMTSRGEPCQLKRPCRFHG